MNNAEYEEQARRIAERHAEAFAHANINDVEKWQKVLFDFMMDFGSLILGRAIRDAIQRHWENFHNRK